MAKPLLARPSCDSEAGRSHLIALVTQRPLDRPVRSEAGELVAGEPAGAPEWTLNALATAAQEARIEVDYSPGAEKT